MPYSAAQLATYYTAASMGQAPDPATQAALADAAAKTTAGTLSDQAALTLALRGLQVRATTDVAVAVYQYFNGSAPSQAGLAYLINTPGSGLNTSYYNGATGTSANPGTGGFNLENRFYNLSVSQAFQGANAAAFAQAYGGLSLQAAVAKAYEDIVGIATVGAFQAQAAIASIQSSIAFFQQVAAARAGGFNADLATKAIIVGYVLEESIKAGVGAYAQAVDQHIAAMANNTAVYNADILATYAPGAPAYGAGVGHGTLGVPVLGLGGDLQQRINLPAGAVINFTGSIGTSLDVAVGLRLELRDASGPNDTLTVVLFGQPDGPGPSFITGLGFGGTASPGAVEILNLISAGALSAPNFAGNNVFLDPASAPDIVKITGSQPMWLGTGPVAHSMLIDASAATAGMLLDAKDVTRLDVAITMIGSRTSDTLAAGQSSTAVTQRLYGGLGGDAFLLDGRFLSPTTATLTGPIGPPHAPIDVLVYKAAAESLYSDALQVGAPRVAPQPASTPPMDGVFGFRTGQDKIDLKAMGMTQAQLVITDKGAVADNAAFATLRGSADFYKDAGGAVRGAAVVHKGADLFLFVDANHNGVFDAATDLAVKFIGTPAIAAGDLIGT